MESYRELVVWRKAVDLVSEIYALTKALPESERFGLTSQLRRAAVSVPSVLAEGHARSSTREFMRYVSMSMGSLAEMETQLVIAGNLGFLEESSIASVLGSCSEVGRMLRGLRKSLESRPDVQNRP